MADGLDFAGLVTEYYGMLYQFAFSLSRDEAEACDLVQQTFCVWASKGHQLRDKSKVKTWLFTTLHREFLGTRRKQNRFPHLELELAEQIVQPLLKIGCTHDFFSFFALLVNVIPAFCTS